MYKYMYIYKHIYIQALFFYSFVVSCHFEKMDVLNDGIQHNSNLHGSGPGNMATDRQLSLKAINIYQHLPHDIYAYSQLINVYEYMTDGSTCGRVS